MLKKTALITILVSFLNLNPAFAFAQEEVTTTKESPTQTQEQATESVVSPSPQAQPTPTPESPANKSLITVSPPVRELELPQGSANSYQMSLTNQSDRTVTLVLRASPFTAAGDTGGVNVADDPLPNSQNWVVINPSLITLEPNEQTDITYTVVIPLSAEPGGFYFAITALLSSDATVGGRPDQITTGSAVNLNVASLNLVTIEGPVTYKAQITEFSTPKILFEYGPVPFTTRILNSSTVHIKPILEIEVNNTWGLESSNLIHIEQQNILPQSQRKYEAEFGGKWHFGRYSATLNALYGDDKNLSYTLFFWIMPWKIILAILLALAIIILLILSIKRQLDEKKILEEELKRFKTPDQEK